MLEKLPYLSSRPGLAAWLEEVAKFCIVGGMNYVVDVGIFNALRSTVLATRPVTAKIISVGIATLFSWVINRNWTFKGRATDTPVREIFGFVVVNGLGALPAFVCLWISHHILGFDSLLADNISGNVIGLIIGTIVRYLCYRYFVFTGGKDGS
ncbi:MAG: GtrA family protein [Actinomycetaceae bacterium]|nr:GtrA family protein [Actinomycetaceae bacterium]